MTSIYILRHGATKLNNQTDMSEDRIRGWTDVPLADSGRKEAQAAALKLKAKGVNAIVASDLSRARETAAIIGKILGVKPAVSRGLRPWNLGTFAGTSTKQALPEIAAYVRDKPDEAVPEGESFNAFKERAFAGLADAIEANPGKVLVIVTHHRNERLYEAWEKAGRPEDLSIDLPTFLSKGDPPGGIKELAVGDVEQWEPGGSSMASPGTTISPNGK
jgi:broad specificity phosphatase PhoE